MNRQLNPHKWHLNGYATVFLSTRPNRWYETTSFARITVVGAVAIGSICTFAISIVSSSSIPSFLLLFSLFIALSFVVIILKCLVIRLDGCCCFFRGVSAADSIIIVLYSMISERKYDNEKKNKHKIEFETNQSLDLNLVFFR